MWSTRVLTAPLLPGCGQIGLEAPPAQKRPHTSVPVQTASAPVQTVPEMVKFVQALRNAPTSETMEQRFDQLQRRAEQQVAS